MPRMPTVVLPGYPHHVRQRGNRPEDVFFDDDRRRRYLTLPAEYADRHGPAAPTYCPRSNHVHLIVVPRRAESLAAAHGRRRPDALIAEGLVALAAREGIGDWPVWLREAEDPKMLSSIRQCTRTGRPGGDKGFIARLEGLLHRRLHAFRHGRPSGPKKTARVKTPGQNPAI